MGRQERDDNEWKYVHSVPHSPQDRVFFWCFFSSFTCMYLHWHYFWTIFSSFFSTSFYHWTVLCCCGVVQCLSVLLPSMVISPNGRLGTWRTCFTVRILSSPLQDQVFLFFGCVSIPPSSFSVAALILFLNNALFSFFPQPICCCLHVSCCAVWYIHVVFVRAGAFNGDLSKWQVGKVTTMHQSTYTLFLHLSKIGSF